MASHGVRATKCASSSTALPIAISPLSSPNVLGGTAGGESSRPVGGLADRLAEEQRELGEAGFDLVGNLLGLGGRALVGILESMPAAGGGARPAGGTFLGAAGKRGAAPRRAPGGRRGGGGPPAPGAPRNPTPPGSL